MLRITIYATLIVLLTIEAASAQRSTQGVPGYTNSARGDKDRKNDREIDRAYEHTIKSGADAQKKNSDPWTDVRPDPPAAAKNKQK